MKQLSEDQLKDIVSDYFSEDWAQDKALLLLDHFTNLVKEYPVAYERAGGYVPSHDQPQQTGVGEWCAPGPAAEQRQTWLLRFADTERGDCVYYDEQEARRAFAQAEGRGWNCYLFEFARRAALASAPVADESPMAKMAEALREKARQEQQAYQDRRNQATEWGPMPEGTEADSPTSSAPVAHVAGDEVSRHLEWAKDRSAWEMPVGTPVYYSVLASAPVAGEADNTDYIGLALELESAAKRVESQTVQRAIEAGAHGLRLAHSFRNAAPQASEAGS